MECGAAGPCTLECATCDACEATTPVMRPGRVCSELASGIAYEPNVLCTDACSCDPC